MMPLPPLQLAAGGGTSRADNSAGVNLSTTTPFNFDHSGWVVNFGDGSTIRAEGNSGANDSAQAQGGGGGRGLLSGINPLYIAVAVGVLLMMRK